ncbi:A.superbus venom factor 1-like [Diadema antillarum]|uniref:A.superbus venom factor 1-like n=2 Tax=Diadema antillarum TaxID=105358 RepID=UPI003A881D42
MAPWQLSLALAAAVVLISRGAAEPVFFATAPEVFRVGVDETVFLSVDGNVADDVPMLVYLTLPNSNRQLTNTTAVIPRSGSQAVTTTIRVEPRYLPAHVAQHHVKLGVRSQSPSYPFQDEQRVLVTFKSGFVFIRTDKPIYVPNSEVKTHVISLDQNMQPSSRKLHVEIKNPEGISVKRFMDTKARPNGFIQDTFTLSARPMLGIWTIMAFYGHNLQLTTNVTFEVREYVLPTFSVTVHPKKGYILQDSQSLEVDIEAKYVYGKSVNGRYVFKYGFVRSNGTIEMMAEMKRGNLQEGRATVVIDSLDTAFGEDWFEEFYDCRLHAEAIVEERTTGHTEAAIDTTAMVVSTPFKFSHKHNRNFFKKGLNIHVRIDLHYANRSIASEVPVTIKLEASRADGSKYVFYDEPRETDTEGRVALTKDTSFNYTSIEVLCQTNVEEFGENQALLRFELMPYEPSVGNEVVTIIKDDLGPLQVSATRESLNIHRSGSSQVRALHYMCVTAGRIVQSDTLRNVGTTPVLHITVTRDMVPSTRIIVYYFTKTPAGETYVTADSLLVDVEENCGDDVTITSGNSQYLPHAAVNVRIRAPRNATVAFMAVDTAVYLLRDKDRLTRRKMLNRMKGYDVGCGPGGGRTVSMVFEDSGMTVLTNAQLDVNPREEPQCRREPSRKRRNVATCLTTRIQELCLSTRPRLQALLTSGQNPDCTRWTSLLRRNCASITRDERITYRICCQSRTQNFLLRSSADEDVGEVNTNVEVRKDFRETWFFELQEMGNETELDYITSAPSSITKWEMAAVSVSQLYGMCVAAPSFVTVFQNFFIQLHLPYSVVRMEQMQVLVTIFNYGRVRLQVDVSFSTPDGLCAGNGTRGAIQRTLIVRPNDANTTTFLVLPIEVGEHPIRVEARARSGSVRDQVEKKLRVVAQGVRKTAVESVTINPSEILLDEGSSTTTQAPANVRVDSYRPNRENQVSKMNVSLPRYSIMGTETCLVSMIADPLGTIAADPIRGLEGLVIRPTGCGEQNMITLGPTVYVSKYLRVIGAETSEMETRAYNFISDGIAKQMRLTAFVVKVFSQANRIAPVKRQDVLKSVQWVIRQNQNVDDGSFEENYAVHHKEMIGAVKGPVAMTAFVLISLLESRQFLEPEIEEEEMNEIDTAIDRAVDFLEGKIQEMQRSYDKAIVAYALALASSGGVAGVADDSLITSARQANDRLKNESKSIEHTNAVYWDPDEVNYAENVPFWFRHKPSAISIETTAYALLAQITRQDYSYAGRIVRWLSNQGNYKGGFVSTQDTVVAMQALAEYSSNRPAEDRVRLTCGVQYKDRERTNRYTFSNDNARVQQEEDITRAIGEELTLTGTGQGIVKAKVELSFNTEASDIDTCPFILNVSASEVRERGNLNHIDITVCTRYLREKETHMGIIDVGIYSGFRAVIEDLKAVTNSSDLIASYEVNDRSVIFYADAIPHDELLCVNFKVIADSIVGNIQAVPVHVYDYYVGEETCTVFYKPGNESPLLSTLCAADECVCVRDACGGAGERFDATQLRTAACETDEHFALKIRVNAVVEETGFYVITATVVTPIKTGNDRVSRQEQREFYLSQHCTRVDVRPGWHYLVVGSKIVTYTTETGEEGFRYLIGSGSKFTKWPPGNRGKARILNTFSTTLTGSGCEG